jgi:hypothetical protein
LGVIVKRFLDFQRGMTGSLRVILSCRLGPEQCQNPLAGDLADCSAILDDLVGENRKKLIYDP